MMKYLVYIYLMCFLLCFNPSSCENGVREDNTGYSVEQESLAVPPDNDVKEPKEPNVKAPCTRRANTGVHEIREAIEGQFPFMAAVMSSPNDYLCAGAVVSNGLILTTAQCLSQSVSHVLLSTLKATHGNGVKVSVIDKVLYPTYTAKADNSKNLGLIYTEKHNNTIASKIKLSEMVSYADVLDMELFGYGLNSATGQTRELQYVGVENRDPKSQASNMVGFIECLDTKVPTCFKDIGGPAVWNNELVGIVYKGQDDCTSEMTTEYSVNKVVAEITPIYFFKAWLDERIAQNEKQAPESILRTFSAKKGSSELVSKDLSRRSGDGTTPAPGAANQNFGAVAVIILNYFIIMSIL